MKNKAQLWPRLIGAFVLGAIFSLLMTYIFFIQIPHGNEVLSYLKGAVVLTFGLPMLLAMLAESNSFQLSILIYGAIFSLFYYLIWKLRK